MVGEVAGAVADSQGAFLVSVALTDGDSGGHV